MQFNHRTQNPTSGNLRAVYIRLLLLLSTIYYFELKKSTYTIKIENKKIKHFLMILQLKKSDSDQICYLTTTE